MAKPDVRIDPISHRKFPAHHPAHFFEDEDSHDEFIEYLDPMEGFEETHREINWSPQRRVDPTTGEVFYAEHPAQRHKNSTQTKKSSNKKGR